MRLRLILPIVTILASSACTPADDGNNNSTEVVVETSGALVPQALEIDDPALLKSAFAAAYASPEVRLGDDLYSFTPAALYRVNDSWVLLAEGSGPDCNACSGYLGVHYLNGDASALKVTAGRADAIPGSSFGSPPQWQLRTDLMSAPVIEAEVGGTAQGISCATASLTELAPEGPVIRASNIPVLYDDSALFPGGKSQSLKGSVTANGKRNQSFTVDYGGSIDREIVYTRSGEIYTAMGKTTDLPRC